MQINSRNDFPLLFDKNQSINIAEIGVDRGEYTDIYYNQLQNANIVLVDIWSTNGNDKYYSGLLNYSEESYGIVKAKYGFNSKVIIIKNYSEFANKLFINNYFDWIYLDANHSYQEVKKDILLWLPKIKKNGILSGHDYDYSPEYKDKNDWGVEQAVKEIFGNKFNLTNEKYFKSWWVKNGCF